ncbi:MAG: serine protease [Acidobacteria bacterium]|nr:MAG: serine protease [Acidobacteriota bacterium]
MATWGEVERELLATRLPNGAPDFDSVRRRYLAELSLHTARSTIVYETAGFSPPQGVAPDDVSITLDPDVGAFMEVVHGLPRDVPLDLILHSPGGTAEAAEAIVEYLRGRFDEFRVIVPIAAMSAATMVAMAADEIVMGAHSQLGPIDPQLTIATPEGPRSAPAAAIRAQFVEARSDLKEHPEHTAAWLPILRSMAPALLQLCEDAEKLSKSMVTDWLSRYMFRDHDEPQRDAEIAADALSDYSSFMSHARRLGVGRLRELGIKVVDLESDDKLQDLVLSVHHAVNHTMNHTGVVKLVENNQGKTFVRRVAGLAVQVGPPGQAPVPQPNRQQRRQADRDHRKRPS